MAKKSYRRSARPKKDNAGCMWGLISLFDFRQGHSPRKLLSDRKNGRDTSVGNGYSKVQLEELNMHTNNVDGSGSWRVNSGMSSVKRLMEEEMSREHPQRRISRDEVQTMISDLGSEVQIRKNHKQRNKKNKINSDVYAEQQTASVSLENHHTEIIDPTEKPSFNFDLASLLIEFHRHGNGCQETLDVSNNVINLYVVLKTICEKLQNQLAEHEPMTDQRYPILRRALADVAEAIVSQNSVNEKQIVEQTYIQSKEVLDALQVLSSNRELILKLFQDSDSLLFKHIQDYQSSRIGKLSDEGTEKIQLLEEENGNSEKCGESVGNKPLLKQPKSSFFWKKDKIKGTQPSKESPSSHYFSRIVVLKPDPSRIQRSSVASSSPQSHHNLGYEEDEERVVSSFSLGEIKRRIRHIFRERKGEQHVISMDGVLHKIPIGCKDSSVTGKEIHNEPAPISSARKLSADNQKPSDTLASVDKKGKKLKPDEYECTIKEDSASSMPENVIYTEAKKHIVELLGAGDETDNLLPRHVSRSLGRLLSFPEYNVSMSPRSSLQGQQEITLSSERAECSHVEQMQPEENINLVGPSSQILKDSFFSGDDLNDRVKKIDPDAEFACNHVLKESVFSNEGSLCNVEAEDIISKLASHQLKPLSGLREESDGKNERCAEKSSSPSVMLDSFEANSESVDQVDLSRDSLTIDNSIVAENMIKGLERLSPVSVLDTIYSEDISCPDFKDMDHSFVGKLQVQKSNVDENDNPVRALMSLNGEAVRTCSDDSQARSQYIKALLEASGVTSSVLLERWFLADQLLDSSLFDEVEPPCFPPQEDEKLLFDCINEVLVEIQERFYNCAPNLFFIRSSIRPAPSGEKLIKEVTKGVERRIRTHSSKSVDEIIKLDLDEEAWIDLRLETESIVFDIWCTLIDDLLEETVFDLWF